jgi:hypothetical protein
MLLSARVRVLGDRLGLVMGVEMDPARGDSSRLEAFGVELSPRIVGEDCVACSAAGAGDVGPLSASATDSVRGSAYADPPCGMVNDCVCFGDVIHAQHLVSQRVSNHVSITCLRFNFNASCEVK